MKEHLDQGALGPALAQASEMIQELRTGELSPQNYYELYIAVTDELRYLQQAIVEHHAADPSINLYELVQYAGNLIPRLYLLCTVGAVYIQHHSADPLKILFDLLEMCKGVQHPTRGLFLRHYLSQLAKDLLPDVDNEFYNGQEELPEGIRFILENFAEVNRLWVRMRYQGTVRDREQREKQRKNLRMIVGTNLVRLSQLECVDIDTYSSTVLPQVLELVIQCNDKLAQEYLMDCLIQVFPDEYHLATLDEFLMALAKLKNEVNIKDIIIAMMDRLSTFAFQNPGAIPEDMELFPLFQKNVNAVMREKVAMPLEDVLSLQVALLNFSAKVYPEKLQYVDDVLGGAGELLQERGDKMSSKCSKSVLDMLTLPLKGIGMGIFRLTNYAPLMKYLGFDLRRRAAVEIGRAILSSHYVISNTEDAEILFEFLDPLLKDGDGTPTLTKDNRYEFEQDQYLVSRIVHLIRSDDVNEQYRLLVGARKVFGEGGDERIRHTLPPLVFSALNLSRRLFNDDGKQEEEVQITPKKVMLFVHKILEVLREVVPHIALKLYLQCALTADQYNFDEITFEFLTQAFVTYEEEIADSRELKDMICIITASIEALKNLGEVDEEDYYDTISTQATQHSSRLLKKHDKVRGILRCSHMFWSSSSDQKRVPRGDMVLKCLRRALKVADTIMDQGIRAELFCEVLDKYLYYISKNVNEIDPANVMDMIQLVRHAIADIDDDNETRERAQASLDSILQHLISLKGIDERYSEIEV